MHGVSPVLKSGTSTGLGEFFNFVVPNVRHKLKAEKAEKKSENLHISAVSGWDGYAQ